MKRIGFIILKIIGLLVGMAFLWIGYKYITLPEVTGSEPSWSYDGQSIVYSRDVDGNRQLFSMDIGSRHHEQLTKSANDKHYPVLSPDNTHIAYCVNGSDGWAIEVMEVLTGHTRLLSTTNTFNPAKSSWSPTGEHLAVTIEIDGQMDVYVLSVLSGELKNLSDSPSTDSHPCWSRDGVVILFTSDREGNREIYSIKPDGTELTRLTRDENYDGFPADADYPNSLVFVSRRDGGPQLYMLDIAERSVSQIGDKFGKNYYPSVSPDGTEIVFVSERNGNIALYLMTNQYASIERVTFPSK